jgi:hypothetical protein
MAEMEKIVEKKVYEEGKHCDKYASKGGAYGVGIPALVLGGLAFANQMFGGNGIPLFGGGARSNNAPANVNTLTVNGGDGVGAPSLSKCGRKVVRKRSHLRTKFGRTR